MDKLAHLLSRAESLIDQLEKLLPADNLAVDWQANAWRWVTKQHKGCLLYTSRCV